LTFSKFVGKRPNPEGFLIQKAQKKGSREGTGGGALIEKCPGGRKESGRGVRKGPCMADETIMLRSRRRKKVTAMGKKEDEQEIVQMSENPIKKSEPQC